MNDSFRARLRAGDPAAFTEAFRDHADAVHRHALWVTGDRTAAEEVTGRIADAERLAAARAALAGLRRAEREVFTLCVWDGLDYAAAALALGVPVGTVRSRLSRARAKLRLAADRAAPEPRTKHRTAPGDARSAAEPAPSSGHVGGEGGRTGRRAQHTPVTQEKLA
jgi:RNA polymerase sigma-70 factor (ECF subfamily)